MSTRLAVETLGILILFDALIITITQDRYLGAFTLPLLPEGE